MHLPALARIDQAGSRALPLRLVRRQVAQRRRLQIAVAFLVEHKIDGAVGRREIADKFEAIDQMARQLRHRQAGVPVSRPSCRLRIVIAQFRQVHGASDGAWRQHGGNARAHDPGRIAGTCPGGQAVGRNAAVVVDLDAQRLPPIERLAAAGQRTQRIGHIAVSIHGSRCRIPALPGHRTGFRRFDAAILGHGHEQAGLGRRAARLAIAAARAATGAEQQGGQQAGNTQWKRNRGSHAGLPR